MTDDHGAPKKKEKLPSSWDEMFPDRFLKAGLLQGKHVTLKIARLYLDELPGEKKDEKVSRGIIAFEGKDRELMINKTNSKCIAAMFGKKPADAVGKRITIYPTTCYAFGEMVDCIRIAGSPDISGDITIKVAQGREKVTVTLRKTPSRVEDKPREREPGEDG